MFPVIPVTVASMGEVVEHYCPRCYRSLLEPQGRRDWRPEVVRRAKLGVLKEFAAQSEEGEGPTPMMKLVEERAQSHAFVLGPKNALKKKGKHT